MAASITEHAAELAPDLVVMSTHGKGSARRLIFGAIAQQVLSRGETPVLLVRPSEEAASGASRGGTWRTILAPLDGDPVHEKSLPVVTDLAIAFACRVHLLMVVPTLGELAGSQAAAGMLLPGATRVKLEMESAAAGDYLAAKAAELERAGVKAGSEASRGDPGTRHRAGGAKAGRGHGGHGHAREGGNSGVLGGKRGGPRGVADPRAPAARAPQGVVAGVIRCGSPRAAEASAAERADASSR